MTAPLARWRALDVDARRIWFMAASLSAAVHLFGAGMLLALGVPEPLIAVVILDGAALTVGGLIWASWRLFPERRAVR